MHAPFFDDFVFQKIVKSLIDPFKGAAPLNRVIGYFIYFALNILLSISRFKYTMPLMRENQDLRMI